MENNPVMFQTTNQMVLTRCLYLFTTINKSNIGIIMSCFCCPQKPHSKCHKFLGCRCPGRWADSAADSADCDPKKWVCLKMGYTPNEIAIKSRDNDQQNHWVNGVHNIFRQTQMNLATKIITQQQPVTASRRLSGGQRAAKRLKRLRLRGCRKTWCIKLEELVQFVKGVLFSYIGLYMFLLVYIGLYMFLLVYIWIW